MSILRENGIVLLQWEQEVRDQLLIQKLIERVAAQVPIDDVWVAMEDRIENEKITFETASLAPDLAAVQDPGDATLEAYLRTSGARFQYGPRRVLDYVALDQAAFADAIKVDDATLKSAYETKKLQYTELDASHILFQAKTEDEFAEAAKKAQALRAKLEAGADFAKAATEVSEDPTAKTNRGRLGWFRTGTMGQVLRGRDHGPEAGRDQPARPNEFRHPSRQARGPPREGLRRGEGGNSAPR